MVLNVGIELPRSVCQGSFAALRAAHKVLQLPRRHTVASAACAIIIISAQCSITLMIARRALSGIHTSGRIAFAFAFLQASLEPRLTWDSRLV